MRHGAFGLMFNHSFRGKTVLVTGHTGFKGSWLTAWLLKLGAKVVGFSRDVPTEPSLYESFGRLEEHEDIRGDVRNLDQFRKVVLESRPDFIIHIAAQAIVSESYASPIETFSTNVMGTANVLEALRVIDWPCSVVVITSDKAYDNVEWAWGYRETDALGGKDVYSGSKGAAELVYKSYFESFLKSIPNVRSAVARAGNVIGGGDWAKDRIVADVFRAWESNDPVELRCPAATRPWQHVLEPLSGYLMLASLLSSRDDLNGEAFNFGPKAEQSRTVLELVEDLRAHWPSDEVDQFVTVTDELPFHEASLLKLNCDKALMYLKWASVLEYHETIQLVGQWYSSCLTSNVSAREITETQISSYETLASQRKLPWAA